MQLREITNQILDFCYPGICASCRGASDGHAMLCEPCRIDLHGLESAPACERCAMPLPEPGAPCAHCRGKGLYPFEKILGLGIYVNPIQHLIHQMKYHQQWRLAEFFGDRLLAKQSVQSLLDGCDFIVAVPLHPLREIARGYNQAGLIARRLARGCGKKLSHPITRLRNTETQTHLSPTKREENMRGAFGLRNPDAVRERHVVIVDDVMTTGATLQAVGRAIKQGDPASIRAIVVARADPKRRGFEAI